MERVITWYPTKNALFTGNKDKDRVVLSRDLNSNGAKEFAALSSVASAVAYADANAGKPLYEVIERHNEPVFAYFDIDRPDVLFSPETILADFVQVLASFAKNCYCFDIPLEVGQTVNAADATTETKTSIHVRCWFDFANVRSHQMFSAKLCAHVVNNRSLYPSLVFDGRKHKAPQQICVVDCAVYTAFRSFRMLGMAKHGKNNPLKPMGASSTNLADHLIVNYAANQPSSSQPPRFTFDTELVDLISAARTPLGARRRSPSPTPTPVTEKAEWYARLLNSWDSTQDVFPSSLVVYTAMPGSLPGETQLRLAHGTVCPYAKRAHKHNNVYIRLREKDQCGEVICYDEECVPKMTRKPVKLTGDEMPGARTIAEDGLNDYTIHSQQDAIDWTEVYSEEEMRPLPDQEIVCVRANMGVGKTVALISLFKKVCTKDTKVLVISYNRSLSAQMASRLTDQTGLVFTNYQDVQGAIRTPRIVVCLDSLARIETSNFDYLVVDEATSVIKHFNSQHMAGTGAICSRFELLAIQAKRLYIMDAAIDTTFTVNVIQYLARQKCKDVYWIWNQYVRDSNRKVTLISGNMGSPKHLTAATIMYTATAEILELLGQGLKVVVPSSTASYTKFLYKVITAKMPELRIKLYNSEEPAVQLADIHTTWPQYSCLIYSPTISAGVSYEGDHFDCLVAVLTNTRYTPPVDEALQQLWRVRNLNEGRMSIYIQDRNVDPALPSSHADVAEMLDTNIAMAAKYCDVHFDAVTLVDGSSIKYDNTRLSYLIIVGIVSSLNKSSKHFSTLLSETLTNDYKVPVVCETLSIDPKYDLDIASLVEIAGTDTEVAFASVDVNMSALTRNHIHSDLRNASDIDKASVRLYDFRALYNIERSAVDEAFFVEYVKPPGAGDTFYTAKRFRDLGRNTLAENVAKFKSKMEAFSEDGADRNFNLFKSKSLSYHKMLTMGQDLLQRAFDAGAISKLTALKTATVHEDKVAQAVGAFMGELNKGEVADMKATFKSRGDTKTAMFRRIMYEAFGLKMAPRGSTSSKRSTYKDLTFVHPWLEGFEARYKPEPRFTAV